MSSTKQPTGIKAMPPKREAPGVPQFFRLNVEVGDLDAATSFYTKLLGVHGRENDVPGGGIVVRPWGERSFYAEDPMGKSPFVSSKRKPFTRGSVLPHLLVPTTFSRHF